VRQILGDDSLSKIKGGFSYKHTPTSLPAELHFSKNGGKNSVFIFFSNLEQVKEMKLGGYFLLVKMLFINIFLSLPYCYKGMKLAIPIQFFYYNFLIGPNTII